MKKILLSAVLLAAIAAAAFAGGEDAPAAVKTKFASLYPNVKKVKWSKEDGNYEAEFTLNNAETTATFDGSGSLLETETEIAVSALPKAAADYVAKTYAGEKIKEASKIVDSKNAVTFEAEVKAGDLIFDANGKFVKLNAKTNEKDEDDDKK